MAPVGQIFGPFLAPNSAKIFNARPWNLGYRHNVGTSGCAWKMAPVGQIFGLFLAPNSAKIRPKSSFSSILQKVSTGFTWNFFLTSLELRLEVCRILAPRSHILGPFVAPNRVRIRPKVSFLSILQKVPLDSHETSFLRSLELLWVVCRILAPRGHILGSFQPLIGPK